MAVYKVLQDIEAEDKFIGPLTLKQFVFAGITLVCLYLSFFSLTKGFWPGVVVLLPPALVGGFLAFPWGRDQPTEIWLLAKLRFLTKPRRRIWDQSGPEELVTITVPKRPEHRLTKDLSQTEVKSRLRVLADTIDSRGWAIKNAALNFEPAPDFIQPGSAVSDRLVDASILPHDVPSIDVQPLDDPLDPDNNPTAHKLDEMLQASNQNHRDQVLERFEAARQPASTQTAAAAGAPTSDPAIPAQDVWFMQPPPPNPGLATFGSQVLAPASFSATTAATTKSGPLTADETALLSKIHEEQSHQYIPEPHLRVIQPPGQTPSAPSPVASLQPPVPDQTTNSKGQATTPAGSDPAILHLASNDDLTVATIARQAQAEQDKSAPSDEVVVSLH